MEIYALSLGAWVTVGGQIDEDTAMEQPEYNMFNRKKVELEFAHLYGEINLGTTIWSPLASGLLTGKYNSGIPQGARITIKGYEWLREEFECEQGKQNIEKVKQLIPIASGLNISVAQLALACV